MLSFYADESGSAGSGQGDAVVLLAAGFTDDNWKPIKDQIDGLKRAYFKNWNLDEVELKSVYLRRWNLPDQKWPPNAFTTLTQPQIAAFGNDLFDLIDALPIEWAAVAFSKSYLLHTHGINDSRSIFFRLYMYLLERLHGWCKRENTYGRLFLDQQHQQLVNATHDEIIKQHHQLLVAGTGWQPVDRIIEQPFFMESRYSVHIQLADILAYNVLRQIRNGFANPYPYYARILPKCRGYSSWYGGNLRAPFGFKIEP
jgi:hypothetical protein